MIKNNTNIIGTIPDIKCEFIIEPISPRKGLFGINNVITIASIYNKAAINELINAFLAVGDDSSTSKSSTFLLYSPSLGSIILVVTKPPTIVSANVETILKYQLDTGETFKPVSIIEAASVLIPDSNASVPTTNKFAVKPAPAAPKPAANPAIGCLPNL